MAVTIKYRLMKEYIKKVPTHVPRLDADGNPVLDRRNKPVMTTEIQEQIMQTFVNCSLCCPTVASYEANLPIAQREAYNGEYTVEGEFDPEPEYEPTTDDILNILLGVNE